MKKGGYDPGKKEEPIRGELMARLLPGEQLGLNTIGAF